MCLSYTLAILAFCLVKPYKIDLRFTVVFTTLWWLHKGYTSFIKTINHWIDWFKGNCAGNPRICLGKSMVSGHMSCENMEIATVVNQCQPYKIYKCEDNQRTMYMILWWYMVKSTNLGRIVNLLFLSPSVKHRHPSLVWYMYIHTDIRTCIIHKFISACQTPQPGDYVHYMTLYNQYW